MILFLPDQCIGSKNSKRFGFFVYFCSPVLGVVFVTIGVLENSAAAPILIVIGVVFFSFPMSQMYLYFRNSEARDRNDAS